jgi:hypothetical protein
MICSTSGSKEGVRGCSFIYNKYGLPILKYMKNAFYHRDLFQIPKLWRCIKVSSCGLLTGRNEHMVL